MTKGMIMGLVGRALARRRARKRDERVAIARAKAEAKASVKAQKNLELRKERLMARTSKQVLRAQSKQGRAAAKQEKALAQAFVKGARRGVVTPGKALAVANAIRTLVPVLLPLGYKLLAEVQKRRR